jgi:hypothetical protein
VGGGRGAGGDAVADLEGAARENTAVGGGGGGGGGGEAGGDAVLVD